MFTAFFHAPGLPLSGQLAADTSGQKTLVDPVCGIVFSLVGLQRPADGLLRINGFLDALPANPGQLELEGLRLWRGDRLDDAEELLGGGHIQ